ncbi:MAG TPA: hypothetical protein VG963_24315 [Polyangiaceae bacterium]|nr:hypothetical protein [Polyangiaceae bacterium]
MTQRRNPGSQAQQLLSALSGAGALVASIITLSWEGAFPAPPASAGTSTASPEARGWSLVTLFIALPLLAWFVRGSRRGALRGRLGSLGVLIYLTYTYLELAVSPPESALYLVYIATFSCALCASWNGVSSVTREELEEANGARLPRRRMAVFGLGVGGGLALAWLKAIVSRALAGQFSWPVGDAAIAHVVQALDLGIQVPLNVGGGLLLLRRRPSGVILGALLSVNASCMGWALTAMVAFSARASGQSLATAIPFAALGAVSSSLCATFFRALEPPREQTAPPRARVLREHPVEH